MNVTTYGYLEAPYLLDSYLSLLETNGHPTQSTLQIFGASSTKTQADRRIDSGSSSTRTQTDLRINSTVYLVNTQSNLRIIDTGDNVRTQIQLRIDSGLNSTRSQTNLQIAANLYTLRTQSNLRIFSSENIRTQIDRRINTGLSTVRAQINLRIDSGLRSVRSQIDRRIDTGSFTVRTQANLRIFSLVNVRTQIKKFINTGLMNLRTEVMRTSLSHANCFGYLDDPYLADVYLGNRICVSLRTQITRIQAFITHTQVIRALYNTTRLRIMPTFPSRGTSGINWTQIIGSTTGGDFGLNNLNTDIVEQVWRSTSTSATIQCDTEISQGIFLDTLAMLNHNFTTSATVQLQGSNSSIFATTPYSENLFTELNDMYWIEPMLPNASYRYWRFVINDPTNSDGYLQIGTIIFGSAIIFNGECIVDQVQKRKIHFSDKVKTEGFTNVSNDRALKKAVSFSFKYLNYNLENYSNLSEVVDLVRTSLKALWIPDPRFTSRFAVFGKLSELPVENHLVLGADNDYIDMDITVDESL